MNALWEFDRLFTKTVLHILEKIFLSLDCKSCINCLEVSRSWDDMLTSESFQRRGKYIFCEDIREELMQTAQKGSTDRLKTSTVLIASQNILPGAGLFIRE